ncbi:hypothetical protein Pelo_4361 [Pelomyxa schiedti]|nr:hypothetical protein Pelo_4361 [Pelomyxa schiedti]
MSGKALTKFVKQEAFRLVFVVLCATCTVGLLPSIFLEAEYWTSAGSWSRTTSTSEWDSCGQYIYTTTNGGTAVTYTFSVSQAGTYNLWILSRIPNNPKGASLWVQFDSQPKVDWDLYIFGNSWRQVTNVTLSTGSHTLAITMRKYSAQLQMDKILITDMSTPKMGYSNKGKTAANIPSGSYCQQVYLEAEFGTNPGSPVTLAGLSTASMSGALYKNAATTTTCSTSSNYVQFTVTWGESVYRPVWFRVMAPTSSYNQFTIYSTNCGTNYGTLTVSKPSQEFQWVNFGSLINLPNSFLVTFVTGYTYLDKIYIGWGIPLTNGSIANLPSSRPTCSACPVGYQGCGNINTCNPPYGCVRTVPFGCYFDRSVSQFGYTDVASFPTGASTVELWASAAPFLATGDSSVIYYQSSSGSWVYQIRYNPSLGLYLYNGGTAIKPSTPIILPLDIWTHIAITYDLSTAKFYANGALVATVSTSSGAPSSPGVISLGKPVATWSTDLTLPAFGIDELRIWSAVLPQATIQQNMNHTLTTSQPNLMHVWSFGADNSNPCQPITTETFGTAAITTSLTEWYSLRNLYISTGGPNWNMQTSWLIGQPCSGANPVWFGIDCDTSGSGRISTINLAYNNLVGSLPASFFAPFSKLSILMLDDNSLTGPIPMDIGFLTSAVTMYINAQQPIYLDPNADFTNDIFAKIVLAIQSAVGNYSRCLFDNDSTGFSVYVQQFFDRNNSNFIEHHHIPEIPAIINSQISSINVAGNYFSGQLPNRATTVNSQMILMYSFHLAVMYINNGYHHRNFTDNVFTCEVPPFFTLSSTTFPVDVHGSLFFCPITNVVQTIQGIACQPVTMISITPNSWDLSVGFGSKPTATINATGLNGCTGIQIFVPGVGLVAPKSQTTNTLVFSIPSHTYGIVPIRLVWTGTYGNNSVVSANSLNFKYYYPCPASCVSPYGSCAGLSGLCGLTAMVGHAPQTATGEGHATQQLEFVFAPRLILAPRAVQLKLPAQTTVPSTGSAIFSQGYALVILVTGETTVRTKHVPQTTFPTALHHTAGAMALLGNVFAHLVGLELLAQHLRNHALPTAPIQTMDSATHPLVCFKLEIRECTCFTYQGLIHGGLNCSQIICSPSCLNGGTCNTSSSKCICKPNYYGTDCSVPNFPCPKNCTSSSSGECNSQTGNCSCRSGLTIAPFTFVLALLSATPQMEPATQLMERAYVAAFQAKDTTSMGICVSTNTITARAALNAAVALMAVAILKLETACVTTLGLLL